MRIYCAESYKIPAETPWGNTQFLHLSLGDLQKSGIRVEMFFDCAQWKSKSSRPPNKRVQEESVCVFWVCLRLSFQVLLSSIHFQVKCMVIFSYLPWKSWIVWVGVTFLNVSRTTLSCFSSSLVDTQNTHLALNPHGGAENNNDVATPVATWLHHVNGTGKVVSWNYGSLRP